MFVNALVFLRVRTSHLINGNDSNIMPSGRLSFLFTLFLLLPVAHCMGAQGKSTLCNLLAGEERSLTGPEPGLTRDSVHARFEWQGWRVEMVDTAGWMRGTRLDRSAATRLPQMQPANISVLQHTRTHTHTHIHNHFIYSLNNASGALKHLAFSSHRRGVNEKL
jgi:hypothetical protein